MRDVTFSGSTRSDLGSLQIESMVYQTRPIQGIDHTLRAVLREKRAFLTAFGVVLLLGVGYLVVAPREYMAEATVMAAPRYADLSRTDSVLNPTATPEPVIVRDPDIEGEMQIMSSPASLRRIVEQLHLDLPRSGETAGRATVSDLIQQLRVLIGIERQRAQPVTWPGFARALRARFIGTPDPSLAAAPDPDRMVGLAVEQLGRKLKVAPIGRSTMVKIEYSGSDPKLAAAVATTTAQNYIATRFEGRRDAATQASEYLRRHTAELRQNVVDAEARLADFRATMVSQGRDLVQLQDQMRVLGERIVAVRADQQKAASRYAAAEGRVRQDGPQSLLNWENGPGPDEYLAQTRAIGEMRREAAKLTAVQGPLSANVAKLELEAQRLERHLVVEGQARLTNLKLTVEAANREVASLEASLQAMRADYDKLNAASTQASAFENAVLAARTVYQSFSTRWQATEQAGFNEAQGWLVSPASVPLTPAKPSIPLVLVGSLVAALGAGFSNALYRDHRGKRTIRSSDDIERYLPGIRNLGLLPEVSRHCRARDVITAAYSRTNPAFGEAAQNLWATLQAAAERDRPILGGRIIAITSALPVEGKSSTIGVLAAAARAAGQRVIAIDCDLRSSALHAAMGLELAPGLADCIERSIPLRNAVRQHAQTGAEVLPAGRPTGLPQGLLQSPRFRELLDSLRQQYDVILIDTPPVLGLSDIKLLARLADHTMLAICWSQTTWRAARVALRTLSEASASVVGVVLTRVDVHRLARFETPEAEPFRSSYRDYYYTGEQLVPEPARIDGPQA